MDKQSNSIKRYPTFVTRLFELIEAEYKDYYDLPVKERNEIMKKISENIMKEMEQCR